MTNQQVRLIATAIIIGFGGLAMSLGLLATATNKTYGSGGEVVGGGMILVGSILFFLDFFASRKS